LAAEFRRELAVKLALKMRATLGAGLGIADVIEAVEDEMRTVGDIDPDEWLARHKGDMQ
jgi:hypothetical protein